MKQKGKYKSQKTCITDFQHPFTYLFHPKFLWAWLIYGKSFLVLKKKLPVNKDLGLLSHNFESPTQKSEKRIQNLTS